ncbi:hypothetical protein [Leptolyngbya sp. FACHB-16]|uniref:hypothetical protein n=1 Tax=unclassified Leptolyngbya TaxID=2650499 RepID=UPI001688435C|nr:hypothetical protein [Leptolyngbya sp. FACHB-16]MBD2156145.1 hypothetical protein [Leptolyngbya sp. FACHB-16]
MPATATVQLIDEVSYDLTLNDGTYLSDALYEGLKIEGGEAIATFYTIEQGYVDVVLNQIQGIEESNII